jgi:hypothetical protein
VDVFQGYEPKAPVAAKAAAPVRESEFAVARLGFTPDALQAAVLNSQAKRGILNCSRQWGKSTVLAVKAVHRAWSRAGSLVLVASPSERQSGEFLRKAAGFVAQLGVRRKGDGDNATSLALPNGSRIVGLPGSEATVRGFSAVSMLLIDEAARVDDRLYRALRPMLAVGDGDLWVMSTPWGKRGFFYEIWANGGADWERHAAKATECGRIKSEFLEEERRAMGNRWVEQEYLCEFVQDGSGWFAHDVVQAARSGAAPLW